MVNESFVAVKGEEDQVTENQVFRHRGIWNPGSSSCLKLLVGAAAVVVAVLVPDDDLEIVPLMIREHRVFV